MNSSVNMMLSAERIFVAEGNQFGIEVYQIVSAESTSPDHLTPGQVRTTPNVGVTNDSIPCIFGSVRTIGFAKAGTKLPAESTSVVPPGPVAVVRQ